MMIPQYRTQRNSQGIFMMEEKFTSSYVTAGNYQNHSLSFTAAPVAGQLIIMTGHVRILNKACSMTPPTINGSPFLLAAIGGTFGLDSPGARGYLTYIWYRTATSDDTTNAYTAAFNIADGVATSMISLTKFSGGSYWGTPIDPYTTPNSTYANSIANSVAFIQAGATGVNVSLGGFVIAAATKFGGTSTPTLTNSFTLTSQTMDYGPYGIFHVARKDNYDAAATNQNTTFTYSGNDYFAGAVAAFNP